MREKKPEKVYLVEGIAGTEYTSLKAGIVSISTKNFPINRFAEEEDYLELTVELPEDTSPEKLQEIIRQAALKADSLHRSNGGNGLQVDLVEVFEESQVPEGSRK